MKRLRILQTACALASLLMLAACTQDELTDGNGTSLSEGKYPLMLTATQGEPVSSPQTRVSDYDDIGGSHKSKWTTDDRIKVVVSEGSNDMETICTLDENGNITNYNPQLYWKTTQASKINAWYSNITGQATVTDNTVNLANQSSRLAYVLKAEEKTGVNYKSGNISLQFKHQLAKVRVKLEKGTYEGDLSNAIVKMKGCCTSCTVSNGTVTANGATGDITMYKTTSGSDTYHEANAVPGTALKDNAFEISVNGKTTMANLTSEITLAAGTVQTVTLTMNKKEPTPITPGETITQPGEYIMTGTISDKVTLNGDNITLILQDVTSSGGIEISGGTPTIRINGNNNSFTAGIRIAPNANIVIQGDGSSSSKLTIRAGTVGIGVNGDDKRCGDITIKDVTVDVAVNPSTTTAAAIGGCPGYGNGCGNILIQNSIVHAKGGKGSAAIGFASIFDGNEIGTITINESQIYASTVYHTYYSSYAACIGFGNLADNSAGKGAQKLGQVTITTSESKEVFFGSDRFKAIDGNGQEVTSGFYKVGKSTNAAAQSWQSWSGLIFNGTELASSGSNGY